MNSAMKNPTVLHAHGKVSIRVRKESLRTVVQRMHICKPVKFFDWKCGRSNWTERNCTLFIQSSIASLWTRFVPFVFIKIMSLPTAINNFCLSHDKNPFKSWLFPPKWRVFFRHSKYRWGCAGQYDNFRRLMKCDIVVTNWYPGLRTAFAGVDLKL